MSLFPLQVVNPVYRAYIRSLLQSKKKIFVWIFAINLIASKFQANQKTDVHPKYKLNLIYKALLFKFACLIWAILYKGFQLGPVHKSLVLKVKKKITWGRGKFLNRDMHNTNTIAYLEVW